jgi:hypothetical protein
VQGKPGAARGAALSRGRTRVRRGRVEVGDDGWGPPVSDRGCSKRGWAALGRKLSWAAAAHAGRETRPKVQGAAVDLSDYGIKQKRAKMGMRKKK